MTKGIDGGVLNKGSYITKSKTPLFNRPQLSEILSHPLALSQRFFVEELEVCLFEGSVVRVINQLEGDVVVVETDEYPYSKSLYTHNTFLSPVTHDKIRERKRPSVDEMIQRLEEKVGAMYVWGGNFSEGISEMLELFNLAFEPPCWEWAMRHFKGFDCSGLLYNVTNGTVPRNTGPLREYCQEIKKPEEGLDLIFTPGHVVICLSKDEVIESRQFDGVCITPLRDRLKEIREKEKWVKFGRFLNQSST